MSDHSSASITDNQNEKANEISIVKVNMTTRISFNQVVMKKKKYDNEYQCEARFYHGVVR